MMSWGVLLQEDQSAWGLERTGRKEVLQEEAGGSQTVQNLGGHRKDAAFYPKNSGKVLNV